MSTTIKHVADALAPADSFVHRHVGPDSADVASMLGTLGYASLDALIDRTIPERIRFTRPLDLPKGMTEPEVLAQVRSMAAKNPAVTSGTGMGYWEGITPPVTQRHLIGNPACDPSNRPPRPATAD